MPARKHVVSIPVDLACDHRVSELAALGEMSFAEAVMTVVSALSAIAVNDGDVRPAAILAGPAFAELFIENGQCQLYEQYNAVRDRRRRSSREAKQGRTMFDDAWASYPKRKGGNPKALALKAWAARVREGVDEAVLVGATKNYAEHCRADGKDGTPYVMQGGTFYGPSRRWEDFTTAPEDPEMGEIMAEIQRSYEKEN